MIRDTGGHAAAPLHGEKGRSRQTLSAHTHTHCTVVIDLCHMPLLCKQSLHTWWSVHRALMWPRKCCEKRKEDAIDPEIQTAGHNERWDLMQIFPAQLTLNNLGFDNRGSATRIRGSQDVKTSTQTRRWIHVACTFHKPAAFRTPPGRDSMLKHLNSSLSPLGAPRGISGPSNKTVCVCTTPDHWGLLFTLPNTVHSSKW